MTDTDATRLSGGNYGATRLAGALDARSDIYAYGCILFEMFTSHRLFPAMTEQDWESAHLESVPTALTNLVPELPGEIDQFIRRCLGKDVGKETNMHEAPNVIGKPAHPDQANFNIFVLLQLCSTCCAEVFAGLISP